MIPNEIPETDKVRTDHSLYIADTSAVGAGVGARSASRAWFAIQTLYRYEFRTLRDLNTKGFLTYLPLLRETRQWTDRKKVIEVPAFSDYIFANCDLSTRSRCRILETSGIVRMLPDNHKPTPIPDSEIESLRRALDSGTSCAKHLYPSVGTKIEIRRGPLTGVLGHVTRINNKYRLVIAVSSISQAISVEVDVNDIEAVEDAPRAVSSQQFGSTFANFTSI